jgi:2-keto-4-pentenoate hydratase/2-oxohepta-3-ene-1,7-dioic acid hydratase in catechol pathway
MRIMNLAGRLALAVGDRALDVESTSGGLFSADVQSVYSRWTEFRAWARDAAGSTGDSLTPVGTAVLGPPVPLPPQVFGIGLNYRDHAEEGGVDVPSRPTVFTKFPASVTGPFDEVELPSDAVDFEAELVAVIGRRAVRVSEERAWSYVAGLTVGQDLSEREWQLAPPAPAQFSLGKSFTGFSPIGPCLVTPDEFPDPDDLEISCILSGEQMQKARTRDLIFSVPRLVAHLSSVLPLLPGDLIFTGTPAGVGWVRNPRRVLRAGDELVTTVEGIGSMLHTFRNAGPREQRTV